ncbi:GNAT family N-acetyltransferase [Arthrobacter pityocampae]|uniref:GNAT family N-acetyltransferase n=1 Tax=Arthrobacter pityocampae TaxID=547334 RepID=UPI0037353AC1
MIRSASVDDLASLPDIERAADATFRDVDMIAIADGGTMPAHDLLRYQEDGRAWIHTDDGGRPTAYLLVDVIDGAAHIEQVSVHPAHAGQGIGRRLIETMALWAKQQGCSALTLTTFADVPWNAPYYARLGFETVPPERLTPGLRTIRDHEAAVGLDAWHRVAMRKSLRDQPEDGTVLP